MPAPSWRSSFAICSLKGRCRACFMTIQTPAAFTIALVFAISDCGRCTVRREEVPPACLCTKAGWRLLSVCAVGRAAANVLAAVLPHRFCLVVDELFLVSDGRRCLFFVRHIESPQWRRFSALNEHVRIFDQPADAALDAVARAAVWEMERFERFVCVFVLDVAGVRIELDRTRVLLNEMKPRPVRFAVWA